MHTVTKLDFYIVRTLGATRFIGGRGAIVTTGGPQNSKLKYPTRIGMTADSLSILPLSKERSSTGSFNSTKKGM
jgi:hypothetical protein